MKEIEIRSRIDEAKFEELLVMLKDKNPDYTYQKQLSFQGKGSKDVRVKLIDDSYYLINLKEGSMGDNSRKEISFNIDKEHFKSFMEFLKSLNIDKFVKWETHRHKFIINGINVDLDRMPGFGYYIEFEKMCEDDENQENIFLELRNMLKKFDLVEITKDDFVNHVNEYSLNNVIGIDVILEK